VPGETSSGLVTAFDSTAKRYLAGLTRSQNSARFNQSVLSDHEGWLNRIQQE